MLETNIHIVIKRVEYQQQSIHVLLKTVIE